MPADDALPVLHEVASTIGDTLGRLDDWGLAGTRPGQYHSDLAADAAAVASLVAAGFGVLSEESGLHHAEREVVVVVDPLDGSTNADRGVPWFATSLCAVDAGGPLAAVVVDLPRGRRFEAVRGGGARCDGRELRPSGREAPDDAVVGLAGVPRRHGGWWQFRALGACALDLCAVADGTLDGFVDWSDEGHAPWDYLGGWLVCAEAGAAAADAWGRDLVVLEHGPRRVPVAAATPALLARLVASRRGD